MRTIFISVLLIVTLLTSNIIWAENLPPSSSIQVQVLSPYSYKADDGTTVVLGEVQNNLNSPINSVSLGVSFMDANSNTIEYKTATTLLQVIPPGGKTPFSISSTKADPSIAQVQVKLAGFGASQSKLQLLNISPGSLQVSDQLALSGTIKNSGTEQSNDTKLYLISYDAFQRVVGVGISDPMNIAAGHDTNFSMLATPNFRATSYMILAESDQYQSQLTNVSDVKITLPAAISNILVTDPQGNKYSLIPINALVKVTSDVRFLIQTTIPYTYYVQVKKFDGTVEFIGKYQGVFLGQEDQTPSVIWTPHSSGSYYIETYVWNSDNIPLSAAGTRISVVLVK